MERCPVWKARKEKEAQVATAASNGESASVPLRINTGLPVAPVLFVWLADVALFRGYAVRRIRSVRLGSLLGVGQRLVEADRHRGQGAGVSASGIDPMPRRERGWQHLASSSACSRRRPGLLAYDYNRGAQRRVIGTGSDGTARRALVCGFTSARPRVFKRHGKPSGRAGARRPAREGLGTLPSRKRSAGAAPWRGKLIGCLV